MNQCKVGCGCAHIVETGVRAARAFDMQWLVCVLLLEKAGGHISLRMSVL